MNWAQRWMADFRAAWDQGNERARIARAEAAAARERLRAASRPARPWLHVTVSPRVARFLEAAGARRGSR